MFPLGDDNSLRRITPVVTFVLIAINVAVFLLELQNGDAFISQWAFVPRRFTAAPSADAVTILSAMFMHGGWMHLGGNMLYLWIFGDNVEEVLGHWRYALVYLACGVAASLAHIAVAPNSLIPSLGASGAIAGVMGMYVLWFPHNQVRVLVFRVITLMPALVVIGLWIIMQIVLGMGELSRVGQQGGVAYMAHIGGAVAGIAFGVIYMDLARSHGEPPTTFGWGPQRYRFEQGPFWANRS